MRSTRNTDALIVGTGPAGLSAALALTKAGAKVVLAGPRPLPADLDSRETRSAALLASSVKFLQSLDVWPSCAAHAAPLAAVRLIDATSNLLRAPEVLFRAEEIGEPAFGYNIANARLLEALATRVLDSPGIEVVETQAVTRLILEAGRVRGETADGASVEAALAVGADGRNSLCRREAEIGAREWHYDQAAIACSFSHSLPHDNVSTELHRRYGPLTTVPLPDLHASALVWVDKTEETKRLMALDDAAFAAALEERLQGLLGEVSRPTARARFPLGALVAEKLAARRVALVGEAAHLLPPIGAQGLNLGFRDAAMLADCIGTALRRGEDPGGDRVLSAYRAARRTDVMARTVAVDVLNRSLLTSFLPVQAARGLALHGLSQIGPLRRLVMRLGMTTPVTLPSFMRD
jgi:2-octaprenyl-6-methoxyphenol hydroxylase